MQVDISASEDCLIEAGWDFYRLGENFEFRRGSEILMWTPGDGWFWCNNLSEAWVLTNPDLERFKELEDLPNLLVEFPDLL